MSYETNVFENLHHRMITNGFEHGQKIRAEHLRKEFGCSASTVREARLNAAHHQLSHIEKRLNETQISEPYIDLWFAAER